MIKSELIEAMAKDAGVSKVEAKKALDSFLSNVQGALMKGDKVSLVGFGTFGVTRREARTGRNPSTGEAIQIAPKNVVKFKAGSTLGNSVN